MLVALNICAKDWALAADNIEWAKKLDNGKVEYDCLLCHDTSIDRSSIDAVEKAARGYFRNVELFCYNAPHETGWPEAPNVAWQSVAMQLGQFFNTPWFWWEADAVPLRPQWLEILETAYLDGKRPFAGHIVPEMGHMNGVAVYPPAVQKYCPKALYCRAAPWDVMLREDTIDKVTPLNDLIYHYPRFTGVRCQVKDPMVPKRMRELGFVLFHGCNDGSILKVLQGEKPFEYGAHPSVKVFELSDVGRPVDESESLYFKEAIALHKKGESLIPYKECTQAVPSVVEQAKASGWSAGIFDLPIGDGLGTFNSGLCKTDEDIFWLVSRRWERREKMERSWHSTLQARMVWPTATSMGRVIYEPVGDVIDLKLASDIFEEAEDPRVIFNEGKFYVSYCSWSQRSQYHARQILAEFDKDWKFKSSLTVPFGFNDFKAPDKYTKPAEKNWLFFRHDDKWHFVYSAVPHLVVELQKKRIVEHKTMVALPWKCGEIRGGTPPMRVGDEYFTFFHSSLPWRKRQKRYYAGAIAFEAKAPFRITRITKDPLLRGSESDTRINRGPLVCFMCGAVFEDNHWLTTFGVNDEATGWTRLPHTDLLQRMTSV